MNSKRGRPLGGKYPEIVREYWRTSKRSYREIQRELKKGENKK